jgi:hypothetical protein
VRLLLGERQERLLHPRPRDLQALHVRGLLEQGADGGVGIAGAQGQPPSELFNGLHCGQALEDLPGQAVGGHADRAAAGRLRLHLVGAVGEQAAAGDDDHAVGGGVGLLQPVGGKQHRAARRHVAADAVPEHTTGRSAGTTGPPARLHQAGSGSPRRWSAQGSTGGSGEWFSRPECQRPDHLTANATEPPEPVGDRYPSAAAAEAREPDKIAKPGIRRPR